MIFGMGIKIKCCIACAWCFLFIVACGWATDWYVSPGGNNSAGANWSTAYTDPQTALSAAQPDDTIYMAGQQFNLTTSLYWSATGSVVTIRGGYAAASDDPLPGPQDMSISPTILCGPVATSNRVLYASFVTNGWIEGIVFTNGYGSGGGLYASACSLTISNCTFVSNRVISSIRIFDSGTGGGLAVNTGRITVVDTIFRNNQWMISGDSHKGAGVYLNIATGMFVRVTLQNNSIYGQSFQSGGGMFASGGMFTMVDCVFSNNSAEANYGRGGGIHATANRAAVFSNCVFINNYVGGINQYGGAMVLDGVVTAVVAGCTFKANAGETSGEDIWIGYNTNTLIRDSIFAGGSSNGITHKYGAFLTISNCLIHGKSGSGIQVNTGVVTIVNTTLADNNGWGLSNTMGVVTVKNSIAWGNYSGGMTTSRVAATYTCSQELLPGMGNSATNPLFALGYYLGVTGLTNQSATSTCIDTGTGNASDYGLETRTVRTDGGVDTGPVDLGFHAANGWSAQALSNRVLYVDIAGGDDTTGNGWTPGTAFKTITRALTRTVQGGTINIAAGRYSTNNGETLPIIPKQLDLTLTGADRSTVFIDGGCTTQLVRAHGLGRLRFETISFTNGFAINSAIKGPGLYLSGCLTTISNCAIVSNVIYAGAGSFGGGIYASQGALTLDECALAANGMAKIGMGDGKYGGGLFAGNNVHLVIRDSMVLGNFIYGQTSQQGGGVYAGGGNILITNSIIAGNLAGSASAFGGALYISGADSVIIARTTCYSNHVFFYSVPTISGAVAFVTGCTDVRISDSSIINNARAGSSDDLFFAGNINSLFEYDTLQGSARHGLNLSGVGLTLLSNCLVSTHATNGIFFDSGTGRLVNVTLANNGGWGVSNGNAKVSAINVIAWGNSNGGLTTNCTTSFSCIQYPAGSGEGNFSTNPLFADEIYFHEQSRDGTYTGGWFEAGGWTSLQSNSPCIDKGDPNIPFQKEPAPNGLRINMGAYGNTTVASKSPGRIHSIIRLR